MLFSHDFYHLINLGLVLKYEAPIFIFCGEIILMCFPILQLCRPVLYGHWLRLALYVRINENKIQLKAQFLIYTNHISSVSNHVWLPYIEYFHHSRKFYWEELVRRITTLCLTLLFLSRVCVVSDCSAISLLGVPPLGSWAPKPGKAPSATTPPQPHGPKGGEGVPLNHDLLPLASARPALLPQAPNTPGWSRWPLLSQLH